MIRARTILAIAVFLPAPALAETVRGLGAHEHGSGALSIAVEGQTLAIELEAPGADIVGFEHAATSVADRAAADAAISDLARPLELFVFPASAGCSVTSAKVTLIADAGGTGHDHDGAAQDSDHEVEAGDTAAPRHAEFHATYQVACARPARIDRIEFVYFDRFPNARELDVQMVSGIGAQSVEVGREDPVLDMRGLF